MDQPLFTLADVAERLGVSISTVRRYIAAGDLDAVDVAGPGSTYTQLRVHPAYLEDFLIRRGTSPDGDAA